MFIYYIIIYVIRHLFKCKMISLYIYIYVCETAILVSTAKSVDS